MRLHTKLEKSAPDPDNKLRGGVLKYAAQEVPQIDTEIAEKGHLWMKTILEWLYIPCACGVAVDCTAF